MATCKFLPHPAFVGPIERQECIRGDPIEPPDELNDAFFGEDSVDCRVISPIEDGVGNLQLSPSTPDRRPKCTCPGAPSRPLVILKMPIDPIEWSESLLANSSESPLADSLEFPWQVLGDDD